MQTKIFAITLFVDDLAAAREFYVRVFERPILNEDPESVAFEFDGVIINLLVETSAPELIEPAAVGSGARQMLTITVEDVDATFAELQAKGVQFLNGPMDRPWGPRTAAFADPAGHVWEIAS